MIKIQPLSSLEYMDQAVELQRVIWGYHDLDMESPALLVVANRFAGQLLGAFDQDKLIGMALAFYSVSNRQLRLHSHRVGIMPGYQGHGVGRLLKLAQRKDALDRGIQVIEWTFDPMQPRNAHFNLEILGGVARHYIPNLYGITSSPLHGGLPTDRLLIEWELESPRVVEILGGRKPSAPANSIRVPIPDPAHHNDPESQARLRQQLVDHLDSGYGVTGFEGTTDHAFYLLEKL